MKKTRKWTPADLMKDGAEIIWLVADDKENVYADEGVSCIEIKNKGNYGGNAVRTAGRAVSSKTNLATLNNRKVLKNLDTNSTAGSYYIENTEGFATNLWGWSYFSVFCQSKTLASGSTSSAYHGITSICMPVDGYETNYGYKNIFEFFEIEYGSAHSTQPGRIRSILNYRKDGHWSSYHQYNYPNNSLFDGELEDQQTAKWVLSACMFDYSIKTLTQIMGDKLNVSAVSGQYTDTWKETYSTAGRSCIAVQCSGSPTNANSVQYYGSGIGLAEAIYMRRPPEPKEIVLIQGYLAHEWGLTDQLPDGHPYKESAPTVEEETTEYEQFIAQMPVGPVWFSIEVTPDVFGNAVITQDMVDLENGVPKPMYNGIEVEGYWTMPINGLQVNTKQDMSISSIIFIPKDKHYVCPGALQLNIELEWNIP